MSDNKDTTLQYLQALGLSRDEAKLYLELLIEPRSHLELSRATGVNRTKVYRLADELEKRSLITTQTDDRGTFLVAADPSTLEVNLVNQEQKLKNQRAVYRQLLPGLEALQESKDNPLNFEVRTYEGVDGFKQMLWHELKANNEIVIFGSGEIESLVDSVRWAENHRAQTVAAGYKVREIINPGKKKVNFTKNKQFMSKFLKRYIDEKVLPLEHQVAIYNNTVATYCWQDGQKVGFEVINKAYADMMRAMFNQYWKQAR
jgi:sugar-specific transcriptional regulator TrmB